MEQWRKRSGWMKGITLTRTRDVNGSGGGTEESKEKLVQRMEHVAIRVSRVDASSVVVEGATSSTATSTAATITTTTSTTSTIGRSGGDAAVSTIASHGGGQGQQGESSSSSSRGRRHEGVVAGDGGSSHMLGGLSSDKELKESEVEKACQEVIDLSIEWNQTTIGKVIRSELFSLPHN